MRLRDAISAYLGITAVRSMRTTLWLHKSNGRVDHVAVSRALCMKLCYRAFTVRGNTIKLSRARVISPLFPCRASHYPSLTVPVVVVGGRKKSRFQDARNACIPRTKRLATSSGNWTMTVGMPRFTRITWQFSRSLKSRTLAPAIRSLISTRCREVPPLTECAPACKMPASTL